MFASTCSALDTSNAAGSSINIFVKTPLSMIIAQRVDLRPRIGPVKSGKAQRIRKFGKWIGNHINNAVSVIIQAPRVHHMRIIDSKAGNFIKTSGFELAGIIDKAW